MISSCFSKNTLGKHLVSSELIFFKQLEFIPTYFYVKKNVFSIWIALPALFKNNVKKSSMILFDNLILTLDIYVILISKGRHFHPRWSAVCMINDLKVDIVFTELKKLLGPITARKGHRTIPVWIYIVK